jgi:hypothetical protein
MSKELKIQKLDVVSLVDGEDYDRLNQHLWYPHIKGYILRYEKGRALYLHNEVLGLPAKSWVDHINRDPYDNRKENLRIVDQSTNTQNSDKRKRNTSGFKGVSYDKLVRKFRAQISKDRKTYYIGIYDSPREAALAYDEAALRLFGPNAMTNAKLKYV